MILMILPMGICIGIGLIWADADCNQINDSKDLTSAERIEICNKITNKYFKVSFIIGAILTSIIWHMFT